MKLRPAIIAISLAIPLAACGGDDKGSDLAAAFCADLASGMTATQILLGSAMEFDSTQDAAANVLIWVRDDCPEQLTTNVELTSFLDANNIPYGSD